MYSLFEELAKDSKAEGIIEICLDCGLSDDTILEKLQQKLNISLQQAQEYLNTFAKQSI